MSERQEMAREAGMEAKELTSRRARKMLHKALVRLCAGLLTILGIKLSAFYFIGLLIVLGLHRDQILG